VLTEVRRRRILNYLAEQPDGVARVEELSGRLEVSAMTIRRDLDWLEERGLVRRVHGGAVAVPDAIDWKSFGERRAEFGGQKAAIGRTAAELVLDGERIILDGGTTTLEIARSLACRQDVVAITNGLPVAEELARCPQISTIVLGGALKIEEMCTVGPLVTEALARFTVDKLFLSAGGFSADRGPTDPDLREVEVKQAMIRSAREVILVADSSKWGVDTLAQTASWERIHLVISDEDLPDLAVRELAERGVRVIRAGQRDVDPNPAPGLGPG
jgi:DeoR family fructose operon transcriptional repressor